MFGYQRYTINLLGVDTVFGINSLRIFKVCPLLDDQMGTGCFYSDFESGRQYNVCSSVFDDGGGSSTTPKFPVRVKHTILSKYIMYHNGSFEILRPLFAILYVNLRISRCYIPTKSPVTLSLGKTGCNVFNVESLVGLVSVKINGVTCLEP